jgi:hypothetical protein
MWVLVLFGLLVAVGLRSGPVAARDRITAFLIIVVVLAYVSVRGHLL